MAWGVGQEGHRLHQQDKAHQHTRRSREAPQCTPSAVAFPGTPTTVLQPLEKARPESKPPSSKDSAPALRACCPHTKPTSHPVISGFVTRPIPERSRPSRGRHGYGDPLPSPHKMTHSPLQEGMSLRGHKKESME